MKASHPLHILSSCITKFTICTYENHVHENGSKWVITSFLGHNNFHFQQPEALTMCILLHSPFLVISSLYLASSYLSPSFFTPYISLSAYSSLNLFTYLALCLFVCISFPLDIFPSIFLFLFPYFSFLLFFCPFSLFSIFLPPFNLINIIYILPFLGPSLNLKSCKMISIH